MRRASIQLSWSSSRRCSGTVTSAVCSWSSTAIRRASPTPWRSMSGASRAGLSCIAFRATLLRSFFRAPQGRLHLGLNGNSHAFVHDWLRVYLDKPCPFSQEARASPPGECRSVFVWRRDKTKAEAFKNSYGGALGG